MFKSEKFSHHFLVYKKWNITSFFPQPKIQQIENSPCWYSGNAICFAFSQVAFVDSKIRMKIASDICTVDELWQYIGYPLLTISWQLFTSNLWKEIIFYDAQKILEASILSVCETLLLKLIYLNFFVFLFPSYAGVLKHFPFYFAFAVKRLAMFRA